MSERIDGIFGADGAAIFDSGVVSDRHLDNKKNGQSFQAEEHQDRWRTDDI